MTNITDPIRVKQRREHLDSVIAAHKRMISILEEELETLPLGFTCRKAEMTLPDTQKAKRGTKRRLFVAKDILKILKSNDKFTTRSQLFASIPYSASAISRDLNALIEQGKVKRIARGAYKAL